MMLTFDIEEGVINLNRLEYYKKICKLKYEQNGSFSAGPSVEDITRWDEAGVEDLVEQSKYLIVQLVAAGNRPTVYAVETIEKAEEVFEYLLGNQLHYDRFYKKECGAN